MGVSHASSNTSARKKTTARSSPRTIKIAPHGVGLRRSPATPPPDSPGQERLHLPPLGQNRQSGLPLSPHPPPTAAAMAHRLPASAARQPHCQGSTAALKQALTSGMYRCRIYPLELPQRLASPPAHSPPRHRLRNKPRHRRLRDQQRLRNRLGQAPERRRARQFPQPLGLRPFPTRGDVLRRRPASSIHSRRPPLPARRQERHNNHLRHRAPQPRREFKETSAPFARRPHWAVQAA